MSEAYRYACGRIVEGLLLITAGFLAVRWPLCWAFVGAIGVHQSWQLTLLIPRPCAVCGDWDALPRRNAGFRRGFLPIGPGAVTWFCFWHVTVLASGGFTDPLVEQQPPA